MGEMTAAGHGLYRTANTAGELANAFDDILNDVLSDPTSFVSPSLSVNAFNRLYNLDDVYFSLFEPSLKVSWGGNIKKYKICTQVGASATCVFGDIMDNSSPTPQVAIDKSLDPVTGTPINKIKSGALSYWSSLPADGPNVKQGGAGANIPAHGSRVTYTYTGSADAGPLSLSVVNTTNVTKTLLGDSAMTASRQTDIVNWLLGQDVKDENNNGSTADDRWAFADALHSRPLTVTYGKDASSNPVSKIFVGTSDGGLRMINTSNGKEQWIIYIPELLANAGQLMDASTGTHIEGLDGSATAWIVDNNNNGVIEPSSPQNDKVYLIISERRGGKNIYAFDVTPAPATTLTNPAATNDITPKFLWRIKGGVSTGFSALGQTWSRPTLTNIWVKCPTDDVTCSGSKVKKVLIFAGGYDPTTLDSTTMPSGTDTMGNAIYIVDPADGSLIWRAGGSGSVANLIPLDSQGNAAMKYAIPSDVALLDSDGDGITDRLYVGDSRGQLFRINLGSQIDATSTGSGGSSGFVFADIGCRNGIRSNNCSATSKHNRRMFFYPPAVASVKDATYSSTATYDIVTIQSGNREDPIDIITGTNDPVRNRIYAFRDPNPGLGAPGATPSTITDDDLYDATSDVLTSSVVGTVANDNALALLQAAKGWYVRLVTDPTAGTYTYVGEKGLSETTIFQGTLYATTYTPADTSTLTGCHAMSEGVAKLYAMNVLTGGTNTDIDHNGTKERSTTIGGGIPSGVVVAILPTSGAMPGSNPWTNTSGGSTPLGIGCAESSAAGVSGLVGTSGGASLSGPSGGLARCQTYWHD
jgi:type IV pilus assembly protein PilY1